MSPGTAGIFGDVVDAISGVPIPAVQISVDGLPQISLSSLGGSYKLDSLPNNIAIDVRFSLDGYVSEVYRTPLLNPTPENTFNRLDTVRLVPDNNMGVGGIGGSISDSQGNLLAGVALRFLTGINAIEGIAAATTVTNSQGLWTVTGLDAGSDMAAVWIT